MFTYKLLPLCCAIVLVSCSSKEVNKVNPSVEKSSIEIKDATVTRKNTTAQIYFQVDLSTPSKQKVNVGYTTQSGSAKEGKDFKTKTGVLIFQPGETERSINIQVLMDSLRRSPQKFYVQLSDPQNAKIHNTKATGTILNQGTYLPTNKTGFESPKNYPGYKLVWSDEFNEERLNANVWNYETGGNFPNNELEHYTSRPLNSFLSSGNLIIEARKEDYKGNHYTSARLTTQNKKTFTYGRIDIRARLPVAKGIWPALWMLGNNISSVSFPNCGEIDIMELVNMHPDWIWGSFHWLKSDNSTGTLSDSYKLKSGIFSQKFHVFSLIRSYDSLKLLVDNIPYEVASREDMSDGTYPFDKPFFLIFNVAVGGDWPGPPDNSTSFPQRMFIDYVRFFQTD